MELLEGVMAFAVVMIVLSTIVTGIAEALLRLTATRQTVLADAIKAFLRTEVAPIFEDKLRKRFDVPDGKDPVEYAADKTMRDLVLNPLVNYAERKVGEDKLQNFGWWRKLNHGVEKLTTYSMLQRLAKTEIGIEIASLARSEQRRVLTDLSRTYERYVAASNEVFRKNAHMGSAFIALVLCFSVNVSAGTVFDHLMNNPDARASLIERADAVAADNAEQIARLDALLEKLDEGGEIEGYELAEVKTLAATFDDQTRDLMEREALPIGWDQFPYNGDEAPTEDYLIWFVNVVAAAALVSLGGPFWYRVFASLSSLTQVVRQFSGTGRKETIEAGAKDQPASDAAIAKEDIAVTFDTALPEASRKAATEATA
ncbi:MAG: hypothetical protein AAFP78_01490 [Pseudomonadota bacterium]